MLGHLEHVGALLGGGRRVRGLHGQALFRALAHARAALHAAEAVDGPRAGRLVHRDGVAGAALHADAAQDAAKYIGVPVVRVDEEMCREAVRQGKRIGVVATLATTLEPTKNTILRMSRECGKHVELVDCLVEGAFGLNQEEFRARMAESIEKIADDVDVVLFAQGSMAYCEEYIAEKFGKVVLSSPRFGAAELKKALVKKGTIK
mgnify:CR=1 FL=1